jgi:hypothetical protein
MKPSEIPSSLQLLAQIHKPAFLWGPPGVGKSQVVAKVATALGIRLTISAPFCLISRSAWAANGRAGQGGLGHPWVPA